MALKSQVWSPATPMPMAESSLYRQRLEVIALCLPSRSRFQGSPIYRPPLSAGQAFAASGERPAPPLPAPPRPLLSQRLHSSHSPPGPRRALRRLAAPRTPGAPEKRRLQEEIRAARRELEEEKLRVERLKRKSLRERWLMDGAAEGPEGPEDPTSQDPQSPEGQAQARIRNLEDSLFTLQSQLQLLQSASTGAQHKPSGRPTWHRQGHRPLSQPTVEADTAGQTDLNKRASLPAGPVVTFLESPSEPRDEAIGVPQALRQVPGAAETSSEANGPCPRPSLPLEQEQSQEMAASEAGAGEAKGGCVVTVVWEGLRATEDCAIGATGPELEAKVEEMVLEAIGDRPEADRSELPSWVKEDRGVMEVVWEGVGGKSSDSGATREAGGGPEAVQTSSPRLQEGLAEEASGEGEEAPRGSPDGYRQRGSGGEEGSFIWVERVTLSEEWEELLVEGLEGLRAPGSEGGVESPVRAEKVGGENTWEVERRQAEESAATGKKGSEEKAGAEWEGVDMSLMVERKGSEEPLRPERRGDEEKVETEGEGGEESLSAESKEAEGPSRTERERGEEPLGVEQSGGGEKVEADKEVEKPLGVESKGVEGSSRAEKERGEEKLGAEEKDEQPLRLEKKDDQKLEAIEELLVTEREEGGVSVTERTGGEEPLEAEKKDEGSPKAERTGDEPLGAEKTQGVTEDVSPEELRESGGKECQEEEVSEGGAPLGAKEEPRPEEEGPQPQEKQEGSVEEETVEPQPPVEGQDLSRDATPLLAEIPAPEQPAECQPLLPVEGPRANPSVHPVPTYAPAQQPEPSGPPEGEEASGPKQKTCQCCAVM